MPYCEYTRVIRQSIRAPVELPIATGLPAFTNSGQFFRTAYAHRFKKIFFDNFLFDSME